MLLKDPSEFAAAWEAAQQQIRDTISKAKQLLPHVTLSEDLLDLIAQICEDFGVDGHRADIVIHKAATTLAAYHGRTEASVEDVKEAAELALLHRRRRQPFEDPGMDQQQLEQSLQEWSERSEPTPDGEPEENSPRPFDEPSSPQEPKGGGGEQIFDPDQPYRVIPLAGTILDQMSRSGSGRRSLSRTESKTGRYAASVVPQGKVTDLAVDATLRAAAPFQVRRRDGTTIPTAVLIEQPTCVEVRKKKVGNLIMFCLDTSGSMGVQERMTATKGHPLAADRRVSAPGRVGLVVFRGIERNCCYPRPAVNGHKHLVAVPPGPDSWPRTGVGAGHAGTGPE